MRPKKILLVLLALTFFLTMSNFVLLISKQQTLYAFDLGPCSSSDCWDAAPAECDALCTSYGGCYEYYDTGDGWCRGEDCRMKFYFECNSGQFFYWNCTGPSEDCERPPY